MSIKTKLGHCDLFATMCPKDLEKYISTLPNKKERALAALVYGLTVNMLADYAERVLADDAPVSIARKADEELCL